MSNVNVPRGFKPADTTLGASYNGRRTAYRIASGYATSIFLGDVVKLASTGYIQKASAGDQMRGVAVGFSWIPLIGSGSNPFFPFWTGGTVTQGGQDAIIWVADDPNLIVEARFTNSTSVPGVADIGANFNLYDAGGNTSTGLSGEGADYSTLTTSAAQWRFLEFVSRPDNDTTAAYSVGRFTPALHDFRVNTGI